MKNFLMNYSVNPIKLQEAKEWFLYKHYAHRIPSVSYLYGLYIDKILSGVCSFGKPVSNNLCEGVCGKKHKNKVYELNRLCLNERLPKNTASKLISGCIKQLPKNMILVSYADEGQGHHGYIYQATNWIYTGKTKERTDIYANGKHGRHYDKNTDYSKRQLRTAKHRYVFFNGSKSFKKNMLGELKYKIQAYPKGDNKRYDAEYKPNIQQILF